MTAYSVIIPTYNRAKELGEALESVRSQTVPASQVIVVDDGSTDNTEDVLKESCFPVEYIRQEHRGPSAARNAGLRACRCQYVAFLDSDDRWLPNKMERQLTLFAEPDVVLVYGNWRCESVGHGSAFEDIGWEPPSDGVVREPLARLADRISGINTPTVVCKTDVVRRVGGFDERMSIGEDTRLFYRVAFEGSFGVVSDVIARVNTDGNPGHLTRPHQAGYRQLRDAALLEILAEACARSDGSGPHDGLLYRLKAYYSCKRALWLATQDRPTAARRRALESVAAQAISVWSVKAWVVVLCPRLVGMALRFMRGHCNRIPSGR